MFSEIRLEQQITQYLCGHAVFPTLGCRLWDSCTAFSSNVQESCVLCHWSGTEKIMINPDHWQVSATQSTRVARQVAARCRVTVTGRPSLPCLHTSGASRRKKTSWSSHINVFKVNVTYKMTYRCAKFNAYCLLICRYNSATHSELASRSKSSTRAWA